MPQKGSDGNLRLNSWSDASSAPAAIYRRLQQVTEGLVASHCFQLEGFDIYVGACCFLYKGSEGDLRAML
jgi:hypothetical protein